MKIPQLLKQRTKTTNEQKRPQTAINQQQTTSKRLQTTNKRAQTTNKRPQTATPTHQTNKLSFGVFFVHPAITKTTSILKNICNQ